MKPVHTALLCLLLTGCASVSVRPGYSGPAASPGARPPRQLLVSDFTFEQADIRAGRSGERLAAFQHEMVEDMSRDLVRSLTRYGIPVARTAPREIPSPSQEAAWLIRGRFRTVWQGSRALRSIIGCGLGRSTLQVDVEVYDLSVSSCAPILTFDTTGGSGAEPGGLAAGALMASPEGFVLAGGAKAFSSGLSFDTRRTARMIAAYISTELARRHVIDPAIARKPKLTR